ncbi:heme-degrading domain-containing protein [Paenibacillus piri]|uniref:UPF0303 protein E1757_24075 n=1 Tax=Paenibacillus piri TaxID=2547395 RepID=A0A4R5KIA3_9BACL|nr:heme-degrading domain-containing protein [Paenibacillus piri]TDF94485.1 heme-degrading domain-containing protein [Paenibacillus piri]
METESYQEQLAELQRQEEEIQFTRFSNAEALEIGMRLVEEVKRTGKAITVDITRNGQCLFHHAMDGTSSNNADWIRRKNNVVRRFGISSYRFGTGLRSQGKRLEDNPAIPIIDYAPNGGAFPLIIRGVGVIGSVTVSGLPEKDDHELVVRVLRAYLEQHPHN